MQKFSVCRGLIYGGVLAMVGSTQLENHKVVFFSGKNLKDYGISVEFSSSRGIFFFKDVINDVDVNSYFIFFIFLDVKKI